MSEYRPRKEVEAAIEFRKDRCEICGLEEGIKDRVLHTHHKDGDWTNNDETNIQTLCDSCHITLHAMELKESRDGALIDQLTKLLTLYNQGVYVETFFKKKRRFR